MPRAKMITINAANRVREAANVHAWCRIGRNANSTDPATSIAANTSTSWTSAPVAIVNPSLDVARSGEPEITADERDGLPPDPHDLRLSVLRLDAHLDAARMMDFDPLFNHERRGGQLPAKREVRATRPRRTAGRRVLDSKIRGEPPCVDSGPGRLAPEGERVADDFLPKFGEDLPEGPQVRIEALDDVNRTKRNLKGRDPGRGDLGDQPFRTEVLRAYAQGRGEGLDILDFRPEGGFALRHDDFLHLSGLADQFEREHADLEFLVDDRGSVGMRDEALHGRDECRADRGMAGARDLGPRRG